MCENDINETKKNLKRYLINIKPLLPYEYDHTVILELLNKYYPYELFLINEKHKYYCAKEKSLLAKGKKSRYHYKSLKNLIKSLPIYNNILSNEYKIEYKEKFDENKYNENIKNFEVKRKPKVKKIYDKIEKAKRKTQQVEPDFLDSLMGLYNRKNTTQKDKVYIIKELEKYYCHKVITFFSKKVDTEYNRQLREIAFKHLQSLGFQPVLRKQKYMRIPSKNKKRREFFKNEYATLCFKINQIPEELEYRIENSKEQRIKTYDFFISHSSVDHNEVQILIMQLNKDGKNIYCDWINDNDYLKRHLVGDATLKVITKRLQQSKKLIFVESDNSMNSNWCKYELNNFYQLEKPIYFIRKEDIQKTPLEYNVYDSNLFIDPLYKEANSDEIKKQLGIL